MSSAVATTQPQTVTFAELCEALSDQMLVAHRDMNYYHVHRGDLSRYLRSRALVQLALGELRKPELVTVA